MEQFEKSTVVPIDSSSIIISKHISIQIYGVYANVYLRFQLQATPPKWPTVRAFNRNDKKIFPFRFLCKPKAYLAITKNAKK